MNANVFKTIYHTLILWERFCFPAFLSLPATTRDLCQRLTCDPATHWLHNNSPTTTKAKRFMPSESDSESPTTMWHRSSSLGAPFSSNGVLLFFWVVGCVCELLEEGHHESFNFQAQLAADLPEVGKAPGHVGWDPGSHLPSIAEE